MITIHLALTRTSAVEPSPNVLQIAGMFGLGIDTSQTVTIIEPTPLNLSPGQLVFITGASGGGKTSILNLMRTSFVNDPQFDVIDFDELPIPSGRPVVDTFDDLEALANSSLKQRLAWLSRAGLNDAFVMLRKPDELSDGQRYRLKLAFALGMVETIGASQAVSDGGAESSPCVPIILADEFCATLDRLTARTVAQLLRKQVTRLQSAIVVVATTHDDLLEPLQPDVLIEKQLGPSVQVLYREEVLREGND